MRIIGGTLGGRIFYPPGKMPHTRPTTDIAKEGLFNMLQHRLTFDQLKTLDLFGGTGSISFELASRGAGDLTIVEKDPSLHAFIKKTAAQFNIQQLLAVKNDVFKFIRSCREQFDFIFAGPPYALETIETLPGLIFERQLLLPNGWFVLEHTTRHHFTAFPYFRFERNYGTTVFSLFSLNRTDQT